MNVPIEVLTQAYLATNSSLQPSERFVMAARQLGIRGPEARKDARHRLVKAEIIPKSSHGGKRWSLAPQEEKKILEEYGVYLKCAERLFRHAGRYVSPIEWVADQTKYSSGAVGRVLADKVCGEDGLEKLLKESKDKYAKFKDKLLKDAHEKCGGDPRAACKLVGYNSYKQVAADWRAMGLSVTVDYRTVEARRVALSKDLYVNPVLTPEMMKR